MLYRRIIKHPIIYSIFLLITGVSSCIGYRKTLYFQGDLKTIAPVNISETYLLRKRDVIQIKITTPPIDNPEMMNLENTQTVHPSTSYFTDYYINDSGYVELPLTGRISVEGYTLMQVDSMITLKSKEHLNFYTVDVKMASFKILAMGEFKSPGQYFVSNETCTIYEAIAIAGDAGDYGDKTKIQLIRAQMDGSKTVYHLDLTDYSGFSQENYYVQPNDILYIQPQKAKVDKQNITYISLGLAAFSTLFVLLYSFK